MKKKPTREQLTRAELRVLRAAQRYGDKAAVDDYSDEQEGRLFEAAYRYAELLRRTKAYVKAAFRPNSR